MPITDPLAPVLDDIKSFLKDRLDEASGDDDTRVATAPGLQFVIDNCCPQLGWLRVRRAYPTTSFPNPAPLDPHCVYHSFVAELEIGASRCAAVPDARGNVTQEQLDAEADQYGLDRSALIQTALCDVKTYAKLERFDFAMGTWEPLDTSGGCNASLVNFFISYDQCCDELT